MPFDRAVLGRTGREVGRLGVSASYGVPTKALETAFERGATYLYWGSRRTGAFAEALKNLAPQRDRMFLLVQSYSRMASLLGWSVERALRSIGYDYADGLLLGLWQKPVPGRILDAARRLKERGLVRHLAVSSHKRKLVPEFARSGDFDIVHFRYNAVHTGAERDILPFLPPEDRAGTVVYTATNWRQLLNPKRTPAGEKTPTAGDCYRFVLTNPAVDVCMTGPADAAQMDHALAALREGPMSDEEAAWMRRVGAAIYGSARKPA